MKTYENAIECYRTSLVTVINGATTLHEPQITLKKSHIGLTVFGPGPEQIEVILEISTEPDFKDHHSFRVTTPATGMLMINSFLAGAYKNLSVENSDIREMNIYIREDIDATDQTRKTLEILQWD